jgi:hypothetical protein
MATLFVLLVASSVALAAQGRERASRALWIQTSVAAAMTADGAHILHQPEIPHLHPAAIS